jgi:hypothetical protein
MCTRYVVTNYRDRPCDRPADPMSRHQAPDHEDETTQLVVPATAACAARSVTIPENGRPGLIIDYGGYELAFEMHDPRASELFAIGLAYAALCFASSCRHSNQPTSAEDDQT